MLIEDKLYLLQIAYGVVVDSLFWNDMIIDARIEELVRAYHRLEALMADGPEDDDEVLQ